MQHGILFALGSALLFGVSTPLAKLLVGAVAPFLLAGLLYAGSGLGLLLVLGGRGLWGREHAAAILPKRDQWGWLGAAILFGGVAGPVALMYGLTMAAASTASLLLNLETVFTALLAWFVFRENFDRRVLLGMLTIVAGGSLLAWMPGEHNQASRGLLLVAVACVCWAIDNNFTRKLATCDAGVISCLKGLVAGAINLGLALLWGATLPAPGIIAAAAIVGFLGYGISLILFVFALRHLGAARASAYFAIAPFCGAVLAILLLDESLTWQLVASGTLMGTGVWLHLTEQHRHQHRHEPQTHLHRHVHDEHHEHAHDNWDGREPHSHAHVHERLDHAHTHFPDVDHRHSH